MKPVDPTPTQPAALRIMRVLIFGVAVGAVASLAAIAFTDLIKWLNDLLFITFRSRQGLAGDSAARALLFIVPAIGGLLVGALMILMPQRRAHNPAEVIEAAQLRRAVPLKSGLINAAAALLGLGSGASVGQYGPLTHLGATLGSAVSRLGRVEPALGIGCGVAAAISTAFSAPIAGIIFAHEVVLRHYSLRAFAPITVASSTGLFIAHEVFQRPALFEVSVVRGVFAPEFLAFGAIGVGGAVLAVVFMRAIFAARRLADGLAAPSWLKPAIAGLGIGLAAQWIPEILGSGRETLRFAITADAYGVAELCITMSAKIIATALCLGFGFAGGVFSPALLIGILFGAAVGGGAEALYPQHYAGLEFYAICGMAAVASPVIGAPLTTILIIFELTRNYELSTAVMVSVVFSNLVAYRLFGRSLFDMQLFKRGFDLSMGRDKVMLSQISVRDCLAANFVRGGADDALSTVRRALLAAGQNEAYIVEGSGKYLGMITLNQIVAREQGKAGEHDELAKHHARADALCFNDKMSVWEAMEAMAGFVGESIAVLDESGRLLGVVHEAAVVHAHLQMARELRAEEHAAH